MHGAGDVGGCAASLTGAAAAPGPAIIDGRGFLALTAPAEPPALVDWQAEEPRPAAITIADVELASEDHRAAVAVLTDEPVEIVGQQA